MNKYHNGKIYKIADVGYNKCYIGSTTESLSRRFSKHKHKYRKYIEGGDKHATCYDLFDEYGVECCKIELIEFCQCETKDELLRREGQIIKDTDCVNRCVAGRTDREYYEDNFNRIKTIQKEYNDEHNDEMKQKRKQYYMENKDKILRQQKERYSNKFEEIQKYKQEYHIKHRDKINETVQKHYEENKEHYKEYKKQWALKNKETITCICGFNCLKSGIRRHEKSKKHQEYLKSLEQD